MAEPGEDLIIGRAVRVSASEMTWRFSASGGPGGQHVNTSNTRVELSVDLRTVLANDTVRHRLLKRYGHTLVVVASEHRSQYQNRRVALAKLEQHLRRGLVVERSRVATKPTRGSQMRRLEGKKRRSAIKADRRRPPSD
ncbi:MAG: aminoacyl-tRNA hydrolase [Microthrixaceae bacterium]|nr:aminoacyl-tRNA hydrolase [Microthrixaceae bacterium]HPB45918.1 alternative ribosome rescue aminoacyl-tRNA hydrolase ArfB [Microthrixaceae bacterium]